MKSIEIPQFVSHLKIADNGYPIPFFVAYREGKPDFRLLDARKYKHCLEQGLCAICGKKNIKESLYFIAGPQGMANGISTDAPMHKVCAEYSLRVCPHLALEKAERREKDVSHLSNPAMVKEKPPVIFLVRTKRFEIIRNPHGGVLLKYKPVSHTEYRYEK